ncbi:sensor kinase/response regulator fusion protein [Caballeronia fortuita]|uniref:histidine kinase n=1 Tax=Caballeronia fortuita TaxID=1777138 RepID=A0A158DXX5_9BURK|nr:ATP-binding protein [Caballeronia fortuita]SAK99428.1 sensor kinase/response regulator fusion protein [Caballeronia fortuita]
MMRVEAPTTVQVLAPVGQDARVIVETLRAAGIDALEISTLAEICKQLRQNEGVSIAGLLLTEESLSELAPSGDFADCLEKQPPWSDIPICILTVPGDRPSSFERWRLFEALGNVTLLARPVTAEVLQSVARGLVRARARQLQTKRHLDELKDAAQLLERRVAERTEELMAAEETLRQAQKMEAIGQLTGGIAHDFNNLLQVISTNMELTKLRLRQGRFADLDRFVQSAHDATQRAGALTHRLLAFARRQTLDPKEIAPNRLIAGMLDLIRRTLGPSVEVDAQLEENLHTTLSDPVQLENALLNLCINARDAMPAGGKLAIRTDNVSLRGRTARLHGLNDGDYVAISVSDTGFGMAAEIIDKAFDPFFTTKPLGQGTGLGLSMVYGFSRQSGGKVSIESQVGKGTTVSIYLPRLTQPRSEPEEAPAPLVLPPVGKQRTVLVVDDEADIRLGCTEVLKEAGFNVIEASDGASGLDILGSNVQIDILVSDIGMPGMNGKEMVDRARVRRPVLPVLFMTGYAEKSVFGNGRIDDGAQLLTKPFATEELVSKIHAMIDAQD